MTTSYDRGDLVRLTATFTVSGVATDPSGVVLYVRQPSGTLTTLTYGVDAAIVRTTSDTMLPPRSATEVAETAS